MKELTQAELKELLSYDPETGLFSWKVANSRRVKAGDIAGIIDRKGFCQIRINRNFYLAHDLAWLYSFGVWPAHKLKHIDGKKNNNRLSNFRNSSSAQNQPKDEKNNEESNYRGVYWNKNHKKWRARIQFNGQRKHLGYFNTKQEAYASYKKEAPHKNITSEYAGVHWRKDAKKWRARIQFNGQKKHLGYFKTEQDAHAAYLEAKKELHTFNPVPRTDNLQVQS